MCGRDRPRLGGAEFDAKRGRTYDTCMTQFFSQLPEQRLRKLVTSLNLLQDEQFDDAIRDAKERGVSIEEILSTQGLVSDDQLGQLISGELGLIFIDIAHESIDPSVLAIIPQEVAKRQLAIAFRADSDALHVATAYPNNYEFMTLLEKRAGKKVKIYYATPAGIRMALKHYHSDVARKIKKILQEIENHPQYEDKVVELVNQFLRHAHDNRASDIHIEPLGEAVLVRYRIDGVLHEMFSYSRKLHEQVVFRIKIMSRMRTDEHAAAQDGRFTFTKGDIDFDVRVSILPITDGENVVMRLLSEQARRLTLWDVGFLDEDLKKVRRAASKPYGMILATGPTGCGKTTTLYAILQTLNKPEVNIMTIEDPVEYDVEHVQQTQVNPAKDLTFATGLRAIVRQDPDIIMVGEVRDSETAGIAINSAMTGHLVLSTIHTNDAATTFPRLFDLGVEPFLVSSSVNVAVAQRLVRVICGHCRISYTVGPEEQQLLRSDARLLDLIMEVSGQKDLEQLTLYKGQGCKACSETGYTGRTGIFEVLEVTDAVRELITKKATASDIHSQALKEGMTTMLRDGVLKMFKGITTLSEIVRVTKT